MTEKLCNNCDKVPLEGKGLCQSCWEKVLNQATVCQSCFTAKPTRLVDGLIVCDVCLDKSFLFKCASYNGIQPIPHHLHTNVPGYDFTKPTTSSWFCAGKCKDHRHWYLLSPLLEALLITKSINGKETFLSSNNLKAEPQTQTMSIAENLSSSDSLTKETTLVNNTKECSANADTQVTFASCENIQLKLAETVYKLHFKSIKKISIIANDDSEIYFNMDGEVLGGDEQTSYNI
ncbi:hypothetical protein BC833DRAFT_626366 [Globomyces pollinis-pini]|nr:hypothetical protein BC833DRAFT_626366 [Globomyces pollinis-pini]